MSNVVTLESLTDTAPTETLRLRLTQQADELSDNLGRKHGHKPWFHGARSYFNKIFTEVTENPDVKLDEERTAEATRRNQEKIRQYINTLKSNLDEKGKMICQGLETMTPEQQEEVVYFWESVMTFMNNVLDYLKVMFDEVIQKIVQGCKLIKEAVVSLFSFLKDMMKKIFEQN